MLSFISFLPAWVERWRQTPGKIDHNVFKRKENMILRIIFLAAHLWNPDWNLLRSGLYCLYFRQGQSYTAVICVRQGSCGHYLNISFEKRSHQNLIIIHVGRGNCRIIVANCKQNLGWWSHHIYLPRTSGSRFPHSMNTSIKNGIIWPPATCYTVATSFLHTYWRSQAVFSMLRCRCRRRTYWYITGLASALLTPAVEAESEAAAEDDA